MTSTDAGSSHTNWALIFDAARGDDLPATTALEILARRYWPALYAYIRSSGKDVHEAADLTQGFVCDVMLSRNLFYHADPARGRFRSLLMASLQNYLKDRHRHDSRTKRAPASRPLPLRDSDFAAADVTTSGSPEQAFMTQWNATMIRQVMQRVEEGCRVSGMESHWLVFEARMARPMLMGESPLPYPKLIERLNLSDAGQAANMMVTVKRRFVQALVEEVARTVSDPQHIEDEMRQLLRDLELPA